MQKWLAVAGELELGGYDTYSIHTVHVARTRTGLVTVRAPDCRLGRPTKVERMQEISRNGTLTIKANQNKKRSLEETCVRPDGLLHVGWAGRRRPDVIFPKAYIRYRLTYLE